MTAAIDIRKGLEGVIVDTTSISLVDGEAGKLYYRGYPVEVLMQRRFAEVVNLIVFGDLPGPERLAQVEEYLWSAGRLPPALAARIQSLAGLPLHPMAILQAAMPLMAMEGPSIQLGRTAEEEEGLTVAARLPAAIASIHAVRSGRAAGPVSYPDSRRYGERFLRMLRERPPTAQEVDGFERTQILQMDHGFNASTFTARVVTSSLAPPASALAAAMGSLYGPLHGAADQGALEMAQEVGDPAAASAFVARSLQIKRLVMGMGHREYRVVDPRSKVIKALAEELATSQEHRRLLATLKAVDEAFVEQTSTKKRALRANLEFYKGVVYLALGLQKEFFTAAFAAARVFGWTAHLVEQRRDNRIIRPAAHYVGPQPISAA